MQTKARRAGRWLTLAVLGFLAAVSAATPFLEQEYAQRWFQWPAILLTGVMPLVVAFLAWNLWRALSPGAVRDWAAMLWALGLFLAAFAGLGISIWPYVVPTEITIWEAATPFYSQIFMFVGAVVLIPLILAYTAYAYWVFRGKTEAEGYH